MLLRCIEQAKVGVTNDIKSLEWYDMICKFMRSYNILNLLRERNTCLMILSSLVHHSYVYLITKLTNRLHMWSLTNQCLVRTSNILTKAAFSICFIMTA